MKILVSGGGTGGHIYPALAILAEIKKKDSVTQDFLWIGIKGEIEETLVPTAGIRLVTIEGGGLVGLSWTKRITNFARLIWGIRTVSKTMKEFNPDVLFMTGGYVNLPVALAARARGLPSLIYLPDIEPALSIKTLSRIAKKVACTADDSLRFFPSGKGVVTGYPVRPEIRAASSLSLSAALDKFDLDNNRKTLFVFGGSRGARSINRALAGILSPLLQEVQVIHITGRADWPEIDGSYRHMDPSLRRYYRPFAYLNDRMGAAFRAADLVVARAGASILGECPAFGLPSILIPYPYAWRYQKVNADYLVRHGAALRIDDETLSEKLLPTIRGLLGDSDRLKAMSGASKALDRPDAVSKIAEIVVDIGQRKIA